MFFLLPKIIASDCKHAIFGNPSQEGLRYICIPPLFFVSSLLSFMYLHN